jgi:beta-phosphoglucomutase-like phosphatase (HAD superfamily)
MPAALLDVDGTLVDTNYHHALAWYRAFRRHGLVLPVWRIHRHIGMGGDQLVPALAGELDDERHEEIEDARADEYAKLLDARNLADAWTTKDDVDATKPEPDLVRAALDKAATDEAVK